MIQCTILNNLLLCFSYIFNILKDDLVLYSYQRSFVNLFLRRLLTFASAHQLNVISILPYSKIKFSFSVEGQDTNTLTNRHLRSINTHERLSIYNATIDK